MPETMLLRRLLLPELKFKRSWRKPGTGTLGVEAEKQSDLEVCPRCATPSKSVYDHRSVGVRDSPLRDLAVRLVIRKRRFSCRPCGRPFTESVPGIIPRYRSTERYRRSLLWACENFSQTLIPRSDVAYRCQGRAAATSTRRSTPSSSFNAASGSTHGRLSSASTSTSSVEDGAASGNSCRWSSTSRTGGSLSWWKVAPSVRWRPRSATSPEPRERPASVVIDMCDPYRSRCAFTPFAAAKSPRDIALSHHAASTRPAVVSFQCLRVGSVTSKRLVRMPASLARGPVPRPAYPTCAPPDGHGRAGAVRTTSRSWSRPPVGPHTDNLVLALPV